MNTKYMYKQQLKNGIDNMLAKLSGKTPMGNMTESKCMFALYKYREELFKRGIIYK